MKIRNRLFCVPAPDAPGVSNAARCAIEYSCCKTKNLSELDSSCFSGNEVSEGTARRIFVENHAIPRNVELDSEPAKRAGSDIGRNYAGFPGINLAPLAAAQIFLRRDKFFRFHVCIIYGHVFFLIASRLVQDFTSFCRNAIIFLCKGAEHERKTTEGNRFVQLRGKIRRAAQIPARIKENVRGRTGGEKRDSRQNPIRVGSGGSYADSRQAPETLHSTQGQNPKTTTRHIKHFKNIFLHIRKYLLTFILTCKNNILVTIITGVNKIQNLRGKPALGAIVTNSQSVGFFA